MNPLTHYVEETQKVVTLDIEYGESLESLLEAVGDFLENREQYFDNIMRMSRKSRVGTNDCADIVDTQNVWPTLQQVVAAGFPLRGRYVNIGAGDGERDDPLFLA